jgi:hypothetical protein
MTGTQPPNYLGIPEFGVPSRTLRITQTETDVTVESTHYGLAGPMKVVYKLDGSDTVWDAAWVAQPNGSSVVVKWRTKARWDGNRLVLFTWNTALRQMKDIVSLDGERMTVNRALERPQPTFADGTVTYSRSR